MLESADSELESSDSTANSAANPLRIGLWVRVFRCKRKKRGGGVQIACKIVYILNGRPQRIQILLLEGPYQIHDTSCTGTMIHVSLIVSRSLQGCNTAEMTQ